MVGSISTSSILYVKKVASGARTFAGWTAPFIPELAPFCSQIKDHGKWFKRWVTHLDVPRIIAKFQHSEDLEDAIVRGSDFMHAGVKIIQLLKRCGFVVLSAAGVLLVGRVALLLRCVKKAGGAISVARNTLEVCRSQNASKEELRTACIRLGRKIYSLFFFLFAHAIG